MPCPDCQKIHDLANQISVEAAVWQQEIRRLREENAMLAEEIIELTSRLMKLARLIEPPE